MKILSAEQLHQADSYTIARQNITSTELMERAARAVYDRLCWDNIAYDTYAIFCGKGNNGGDGLALARLLLDEEDPDNDDFDFDDDDEEDNDFSFDQQKSVTVYILNTSRTASNDFRANFEKLLLTDSDRLSIVELSDFKDLRIEPDTVIIDAIFGSGLNRPIEGIAAQYINYLNSLINPKISIDIPSGLYADKPVAPNDTVFKADRTYTFHAPKLQFMFAENEQFVGEFSLCDITLDDSVTEEKISFLLENDIHLNHRARFAHKGMFGHALLVAGSFGKMGAATLATKASLRMGCGLITTHVPACGYEILQISVPEAMASVDGNKDCISTLPDSDAYSAVGIGPGIGTSEETCAALAGFLRRNKKPLVLDADALNIISLHKELLDFLGDNTIITPHPKEFDRLTHPHKTCYERYLTQLEFSRQHRCIVVLKGHHTTTTTPDGRSFFNSTGNVAMATAGSGDVLTGIILSLLAQGHSAEEAAKFGVFIHGEAGDDAADGGLNITASDIIQEIKYRNFYVRPR